MGHGLATDVVLLADAGPTAGLGHVSRSSALAVALRCRGLSTACFALGADAPVDRDGIHWECADRPPPAGRAIVVLDSYRVPASSLGSERGPLVLFRESPGEPPEASVVVNLGAEASTAPRLLYGPRYACLRPLFWGLPRREVRPRVEHVLVTTGATPAEGLGGRVAAAVADALPQVHVTLVRGPYDDGAPPANVDLLDAPDSLLDPLLEADVAVTAAGQSMLEAAAVGTPCVALVAFENQRLQARQLASRGAVETVRPSAEAAAAAVSALAADAEAREALSRAGQATIDGYGAHRVAFAIAALRPRA